MAKPMDFDELGVVMTGLRPRQRKYAELLLREGVNVQPGQEVAVTAPAAALPFVRMVVEEAYKAGAGHVTVMWKDDELSRLEYENVETSWFEKVPEWRRVQLNGLAEKGACFLWLDGDDPDGLKGIDPVKIATGSRAVNTQCDIWRSGLDFGRNAWSIGGVPTQAWATKVFPDKEPGDALLALWDAVLEVARVTSDPQSEWETHNAMLEKSKRRLNAAHFSALRYQASNGTDLTVGLTSKHIWEGGAATTVGGVRFFPNIPTEEIFTTPDRSKTEGIVHSALPLVHAGKVVRDFWFRFEGGRVVEFDAAEGRDVLASIIKADDGAAYLGECALISKNTPIRESGLLFYSTLYDENASCHLALGMGFPECFEGGFDLSPDELLTHGVNQSSQHVDFMIGTDDLDITGIKPDGKEVPVFTHGQWAWE
ncbi:aminopeptidase [Olsenella sp. YH-ols2217]|uniref:Aminopeptidase n=1 Tax=Kribbibacterium absianum TaxID=3044210 RepID=A0ABT6ZJH4_9ACTN|nr:MULTISPECIES: aminopeptidase [unclassified Olsenella]MDJ1122814.1 aminopeptidase [Olsenella sp. YH-ols2216]MDJ1129203.1 aminopeptidase [Olsenella sp. YH-ols2217]